MEKKSVTPKTNKVKSVSVDKDKDKASTAEKVVKAKKTVPLKPKKRRPGAGLKKGQTNNPSGRPIGALNKANSAVKQMIADFYLGGSNETNPELGKILQELSIDKENKLSLEFKIEMSYKYLRFIAAYARNEQEVEDENKIRNLFIEKFLGVKS